VDIADSSLVGQLIGGYRLIDFLGKGTMGGVFEARHAYLDLEVAMKMLHPANATDEEYAQRFEQEARIISQLNHPHVIPIFDYGADGGFCFIVMPLLKGGTLKMRLEKLAQESQPLMSPREIARLLTMIASALDYAHLKGIIHRDVKTSNIVFDSDGKPVLVDFGIAKLQTSNLNTLTSVTLGTPAYMAPELWRGERNITGAVDQYAIGVITYLLLTGRFPFNPNLSPASLMYQHLEKDPPPVHELRSDVSPIVSELVQRTLEKSPEDRFPNIRTFVKLFIRATEHVENTPSGIFKLQTDEFMNLETLPPPPPPDETDDVDADEADADEYGYKIDELTTCLYELSCDPQRHGWTFKNVMVVRSQQNGKTRLIATLSNSEPADFGLGIMIRLYGANRPTVRDLLRDPNLTNEEKQALLGLRDVGWYPTTGRTFRRSWPITEDKLRLREMARAIIEAHKIIGYLPDEIVPEGF